MSTSAPTSMEESDHAAAQPEGMTFAKIVKSIFRGLLLAFLFNQIFNYLFQSKAPTPATNDIVPNKNSISPSASYSNIWNFDEFLDLHVYASDHPNFVDFQDPKRLIWRQFRFHYGDWDLHLKKNATLKLSPLSVHENSTLYCHVYVTKHAISPNPMMDSYDPFQVIYRRIPLTKHLLETVPIEQKNLLASFKPTPRQDLTPRVVKSFWNNNLTINVVVESSVLNPSQLPDFLKARLDFIPSTKSYKPYVYLNEFWSTREGLVPMSANTTSLNLNLQFYPISLFKLQLYLGLEQSFHAHSLPSNDVDEIKRMFLETHPGLLALTFFVTLLHSLFEFLAFKNDVQFWKGRQNLHGISVRSLLINLVIQGIIFLYLVDHASQTSYVILISHGISLLLELWKVTQAVTVTVHWHRGMPRFHWKERGADATTKAYDEQAFRYLQAFIYPCMALYSLYRLMYEEHKGWYSFLLSTAVGFVYAFSFLQLTPQLFINYKLKSVAHMNTRTLTYKFLTTILDDLYSFIIKMPTWHRLAVFRDDVVFVIFLFQRYAYRVDVTRPNEYGQLPPSSAHPDPKETSPPEPGTPTTPPSESKKSR